MSVCSCMHLCVCARACMYVCMHACVSMCVVYITVFFSVHPNTYQFYFTSFLSFVFIHMSFDVSQSWYVYKYAHKMAPLFGRYIFNMFYGTCAIHVHVQLYGITFTENNTFLL